MSDDGVQVGPVRRETLASVNGKELLGEIIEGMKFVDGIKEVAA